MTPKDQSKYPYDRSEYVVMPPIRKAEDGTLTTEPQKVEGDVWGYCPECGNAQCETLTRFDNGSREMGCKSCVQIWFTDIDYTDVVRSNLATFQNQKNENGLQNVGPKSREECERIAKISIRLNEDGSYGYTHSGMLSYEHILKCINIHSGLSHPEQEPPPIDVEALKREIAPILWRDWDDLIDKEQNSITAIVDHLASAGYFRAPLPRIEGLEEALACLDDDSPQYTYNLIVQFKEKYKCMPNVKFQEAARAYLKASGV